MAINKRKHGHQPKQTRRKMHENKQKKQRQKKNTHTATNESKHGHQPLQAITLLPMLLPSIYLQFLKFVTPLGIYDLCATIEAWSGSYGPGSLLYITAITESDII